jgi:hypothetical protein
VETLEHDFGIVDPAEKCRYAFVLRNTGDAPLEIRKGAASCKCVLDDIPARVIEPGGSVAIGVAVKLTGREGPFEDRISVRTNDPAHATLEFVLRGSIRRYLATDPDALVWHNVNRRGSKTADVLLYSQVWDRFDVKRVDASSPAVTCDRKPAPAERLAEVGAKAGYLLKVRLNVRDVAPGDAYLHESLQLVVSPESKPDKRRSVRLPLQGTFATTITVSGAGLTPDHTLSLGTLRRGEEGHRRLIMKVHDSHRKLLVKRIETHPEYLKVSVLPLSAKLGARGLYHIDVRVPDDTPPVSYTEKDPAWFRIVTDHPTVPEVRMPVEFIVTGS